MCTTNLGQRPFDPVFEATQSTHVEMSCWILKKGCDTGRPSPKAVLNILPSLPGYARVDEFLVKDLWRHVLQGPEMGKLIG